MEAAFPHTGTRREVPDENSHIPKVQQLPFFPRFSQRAHLGQGTRTNIYDGVLSVCGNSGNDDEAEYFSTEQNNNNSRELHVVLKVLDPSHRDIALVSPSRDLGRWDRDPGVG